MLMRRALLVLVALLLAVPAVSAQAQSQGVPDIVGTWEAVSFALHDAKHGFTTSDGQAATFVVKEQRGRVFAGEVTWGGKTPGSDAVSGVIDKNGEDFYFVGHKDAVRLGKLEGPDAMVFYYLSPGGDNPRAGYVEYKRKQK
ncbi:MAG: hypothetical protein B193_2109 [Solidesulfovibrio magneticus str. Maddingley MBC34]|uniref:Lipocalin-like domain-containing protein n=1 Tax=Solidesulfovibrio magneticus str. Maddingley MBC34 TaxID=1206767 RepID=K6GQG5_9BACT|nr:MAG: hypothetical protein B193_2109 [Solidesulfovibrio magneticus str. Maddingley MBC34]